MLNTVRLVAGVLEAEEGKAEAVAVDNGLRRLPVAAGHAVSRIPSKVEIRQSAAACRVQRQLSNDEPPSASTPLHSILAPSPIF